MVPKIATTYFCTLILLKPASCKASDYADVKTTYSYRNQICISLLFLSLQLKQNVSITHPLPRFLCEPPEEYLDIVSFHVDQQEWVDGFAFHFTLPN
jgi:hypothetical protein